MRGYYIPGYVQRMEAVQKLSGGLVFEKPDQETIQHALGFLKILARVRGNQRLLVAWYEFRLFEVVLKRDLRNVVNKPNRSSLAAWPVNAQDYVVWKYSPDDACLPLTYKRLRLKLLRQRLSAKVL